MKLDLFGYRIELTCKDLLTIKEDKLLREMELISTLAYYKNKLLAEGIPYENIPLHVISEDECQAILDQWNRTIKFNEAIDKTVGIDLCKCAVEGPVDSGGCCCWSKVDNLEPGHCENDCCFSGTLLGPVTSWPTLAQMRGDVPFKTKKKVTKRASKKLPKKIKVSKEVLKKAVLNSRLDEEGEKEFTKSLRKLNKSKTKRK